MLTHVRPESHRGAARVPRHVARLRAERSQARGDASGPPAAVRQAAADGRARQGRRSWDCAPWRCPRTQAARAPIRSPRASCWKSSRRATWISPSCWRTTSSLGHILFDRLMTPGQRGAFPAEVRRRRQLPSRAGGTRRAGRARLDLPPPGACTRAAASRRRPSRRTATGSSTAPLPWCRMRRSRSSSRCRCAPTRRRPA